MHITLTYRGPIPGNARKKQDVWRLREAFHHQLAKIRNTEQFNYVDSYLATATHQRRGDLRRRIGGKFFNPFITDLFKTRCSLYIRVFRGMRQFNPVLGNVDLDNRVKTIIDGLRAPSQQGEMIEIERETTYVLIDDDSIVDGITIKSDHLLDEDDEEVVLAIVTANIHLSHATWENIHLGYPSEAY